MPQFIPLVRPSLPTPEELEHELRAILASGRLTNFGPTVVKLERETAARLGVRHAAAVSNATTGLTLLLQTLPKGSEVILPSFTFVATAQAVLWNGLVPIFADIDPRTFNVAPESVRRCISERTSAILGVHAFGVPCDVEALTDVARRHNLFLFFDAAHAFGSRHRGVPVGGCGDAEVFSLSATKVLPAGEGGLVTTNDDRIHRAILDRRNYGLRTDGSRDCANLGANGKLEEINALLALRALDTLDAHLARRNELALRYRRALGALPGLRFQHVPDGDFSTYKDFTIQVDPVAFGMSRDALQAELKRQSIETAPYFWPAVHQMTLFRPYATLGDALPYTDVASSNMLSLPLYEELSGEQADFVAGAVIAAHQAVRSAA